jgi:hypothetical protein
MTAWSILGSAVGQHHHTPVLYPKSPILTEERSPDSLRDWLQTAQEDQGFISNRAELFTQDFPVWIRV